MAPFNKILVAVDFSECSAHALKQALQVRAAFNAQLHVLHAYDIPAFLPPQFTMMVGQLEGTLADHAESYAQEELKRFLAEHLASDAPVSSSVVLGPAGSTIVEQAKDGHYDLIVMGTHGRTGLSRVMLGSTADKVIQRAPCPVLAVRQEVA